MTIVEPQPCSRQFQTNYRTTWPSTDPCIYPSHLPVAYKLTCDSKVGVIGYGLSAKVFHIPFVTALSEFEFTHILQRSSRDALNKHPDLQIVTTPEALFATDVELVIITTPPESHFSLAKAALAAGKHVVCEKPFTPTLEEAEELVRLSDKSSTILTVFQNRRWDGDFLTVKRLIERKVLGRVVNFNSAMDRFKPSRQLTGSRAWKEQNAAAGGTLLDLGSHLVDQALSFFGMPATVHANILHQREASSVNNDFFGITLDYTPSDGPLVHLQAGNLVRDGFSPRFRIDGTNGSFVKYGADVQEPQIRDEGMSPLQAGYGVDPQSDWARVDTEIDGIRYVGTVETMKGDYSQFYRKLAIAIRTNDKAAVPVKPIEALQCMRVLDAAKKSSDEKIVVSFA
jgi:scyllo-inositol 2-dehydrogenase (NADP+)